MAHNRKQVIDKIIQDLGKFRSTANSYAIDRNREFLEAIKSPATYIVWLLTKAGKIDRDKMLELTDFPNDEWEEDLHKNLIRMERKRIPGMIEPLRRKIVKFIIEKNPRVVANLGAGAMELERQIISDLLRKNYKKEIIFLAVDRSKTARSLAIDNLKHIKDNIYIREANEIDQKFLDGLSAPENIKVVLCNNDIFNLENNFGNKFFDLIFYAKFKHHLNKNQKYELERLLPKIGRHVMEYDDYWSIGMLIPQSIATWRYPVLINGAVISRLRDCSRDELLKKVADDNKLYFFKVGSYLLEYFY